MRSNGLPPLAGVRVIELGNHVAGPYAATLLSDFGADVIRIEAPAGHGRDLSGHEPEDPDRTLFQVGMGRNKKSVALDLRTPAGSALLLGLVEQSDVLIENFRAGTLEAWGLGPGLLLERNPDLVVLRVSGYGQEGPRSTTPGVDRIAQAFSGAMYVTGYPDAPPVRAGVAFADYGAGLLGAFGILLALRARDAAEPGSERGQVLDVSLFDSILPMLGEDPELFRRHGRLRERSGNRHRGTAPGDGYAAADGGWVMVSVPGDAVFGRLAELIGRPGWRTDPRFQDAVSRDQHGEELAAGLSAWISARPAAGAVSELTAAGVPAGPIHSVADLLDDPQILERGSFESVSDARLGQVLMAAPVPRLSRTPGRIRSSAPLPGEHTREVLAHLLGTEPEASG